MGPNHTTGKVHGILSFHCDLCNVISINRNISLTTTLSGLYYITLVKFGIVSVIIALAHHFFQFLVEETSKFGRENSIKSIVKEVLRRENQGLKVYPVDGSEVFSMTGTYF